MVYFVTDSVYTKHLTGPWHPEQPARVTVINRALEHALLKSQSNTLSPRLATEDEVLLCHTQDYLKLVQQQVEELDSHEVQFLSTGDVVISSESLSIALLAVGGVLVAIDQVMKEPGSRVFCIVRPPGHHACSSAGMGFCLFNNAAIGARYVQKKYQLKRVLIVDWDVHHGNGTQEIFYDDPTVFYFSTHEEGLYPQTGFAQETGNGAGKGTNLNVPIYPNEQAREEVLRAFDGILRERMKTFKPECVIISAGFDAHISDPLGHFNLTDRDFFDLTRIVQEIANRYANGRVVSVLEGGYQLQALASACVSHAQALCAS